jgi:hypothetical protein
VQSRSINISGKTAASTLRGGKKYHFRQVQGSPYHKNGDSKFLQNFVAYTPIYVASHPGRVDSSSYVSFASQITFKYAFSVDCIDRD